MPEYHRLTRTLNLIKQNQRFSRKHTKHNRLWQNQNPKEWLKNMKEYLNKGTNLAN